MKNISMHLTLVYIYCTELVVKPHGDLMMGCMLAQFLDVVFSLKGELCSHDIPAELKANGVKAKANKVKKFPHARKYYLAWVHHTFILQGFPFQNGLSIRSCTNRLIPQTWLLRGVNSDPLPPVSLKHLFSQC